MKLSLSNIKNLKSRTTNKLEKDVCNYIIEEWHDYEDKKDIFTDVLKYGCQTGIVSKLIYYIDTVRYYKKFKTEINDLLYNLMQDCGFYSCQQLFRDKWNEEDPLANEDINHETIQSDNIVEDNLVPEVDVSAPINEEEEKTFSYITNSVCESMPFEVDKINNTNYQQIDGYSVGEIQNVSELESIPAVISNIEENTNPNYAYALSANTEYSGNITQEGEIRWYAFDISGKTKISVFN